MSDTPSSEENDYIAPIIPVRETSVKRRTSVFAPKGIKLIKPKTTVFKSLDQLSSRPRAAILWGKLRTNVVRLV